MSQFDWYDGMRGEQAEALKAAGMPEDVLEWDTVDTEEEGGKHDCTNVSAFYIDPEKTDEGYWINTTCSYNYGMQSANSCGNRMRRKMVQRVMEVPEYEVVK